MHRYLKSNIVPVLAMKTYLGCGGIAPLILDFSAKRRWVVNFTPLSLCPLVKSSGTHWIGDLVSPKDGLAFSQKRQISFLPVMEPQNMQPLP